MKESSGTVESGLHMRSTKGLFCSDGLILKSKAIRISSLLALFVLEVTSSKSSLGVSNSNPLFLFGLCLFCC